MQEDADRGVETWAPSEGPVHVVRLIVPGAEGRGAAVVPPADDLPGGPVWLANYDIVFRNNEGLKRCWRERAR
jgi:hypothetical protein